MIFKWLLLAALCAFIGVILLLPRHKLHRKSLVLLLVAVMFAFALNPEWSTRIANALGVGRGADLLFYLSHLVLFLIAFVYYVKFKDIERRFAVLVRQVTLAEHNTPAAQRAQPGA